jgi:hypothetical protein
MSPEWLCRLAFAVLVVIPFVRVIAISVPALASTREFVDAALQAALRRGIGFNVGVAVGWLVVSYLALSLGWRGTARRLWLAFGVTLIFASLPLFILFRPLGSHDRPGQLFLIGLWLGYIGIPIGVLAFLLYVAVILAIRDFASGR